MPTTDPTALSAASIGSVSHDAIALRAFHLYCERGCQDGRDLDDWLQAERELRGAAASTAA